MVIDEGKGAAPVLLTGWADEEFARLKAVYGAKRAQLVTAGEMDAKAQLHPQLKPIHDNILILKFAFDAKRRRGTGRVRMLLAMHSFVGSADPTERVLWPSLGRLARMAGFSDRKNADHAINDLIAIGLLTAEPGAGRNGTHRYTLWQDSLVQMVFACATGELAVYALMLRELRVNYSGEGKASLRREKVRSALAEGVMKSDGTPVLDRTLSNEMIVRHIEALRTSNPPLLIKLGEATATTPFALGKQTPTVGRFWDRKDKGKPKPRKAKETSFVEATPLSKEIEFAQFPEESLMDLPSPTPGEFG